MHLRRVCSLLPLDGIILSKYKLYPSIFCITDLHYFYLNTVIFERANKQPNKNIFTAGIVHKHKRACLLGN